MSERTPWERIMMLADDARASIEPPAKRTRIGLAVEGELFHLHPDDVSLAWLVVRVHPDDAAYGYVVPVDDCPLVGACDVGMADQRTIRLNHGRWIPLAVLRSAVWEGVLGDEDFERASERLEALATGQLVPSGAEAEVEADPDHEEQVMRLQAAEEALIAWAESLMVLSVESTGGRLLPGWARPTARQAEVVQQRAAAAGEVATWDFLLPEGEVTVTARLHEDEISGAFLEVRWHGPPATRARELVLFDQAGICLYRRDLSDQGTDDIRLSAANLGFDLLEVPAWLLIRAL